MAKPSETSARDADYVLSECVGDPHMRVANNCFEFSRRQSLGGGLPEVLSAHSAVCRVCIYPDDQPAAPFSETP